MAAARFMPGVCGVLVSSSLEWTIRTPFSFQFIGFSLLRFELCASLCLPVQEKFHPAPICRQSMIPGSTMHIHHLQTTVKTRAMILARFPRAVLTAQLRAKRRVRRVHELFEIPYLCEPDSLPGQSHSSIP